MPVPVVENWAGAGVTAGAGNFIQIGDRDDFGGLSETPEARGGCRDDILRECNCVRV